VTTNDRPIGPTLVYGLGILIGIGCMLRLGTGYYASEAPWLFGGLLASVALAWVGRRMGERS